MKFRYLMIVVAITSIFTLGGCKDDTTPLVEPLPPLTEESFPRPNTISENKSNEETKSSGYVLDDKARVGVRGYRYSTSGIDSYLDDTVRPSDIEEKSETAVSEDTIPVEYRIFVDPGHGGDAACDTVFNGVPVTRLAGGAAFGDFPANSLGTTSGTSGGGYSECDVMYQYAVVIKDVLESKGYSVDLSRDDVHPAGQGGGTAIGNWERGRLAVGYDAWIVLHADGGGGSGYHCVVYNNDPDFKSELFDDFLYYMENEYKRPIYSAGGFSHGYSGNSSGILQAPTMYINHGGDINNMLYIEAGFMDNSEDLAYMTSDQGKKETAEAIAYALDKHFLTETDIKQMLNDDTLQIQ